MHHELNTKEKVAYIIVMIAGWTSFVVGASGTLFIGISISTNSIPSHLSTSDVMLLLIANVLITIVGIYIIFGTKKGFLPYCR